MDKRPIPGLYAAGRTACGVPRTTAGYASGMSVGDATFSLHRVSEARGDGGIVVYFELDDLDGAVRRLAAAGIRFESQPRDQPWLWREAYLRDPAGNLICLYHAGENRRNPPWRIDGRG